MDLKYTALSHFHLLHSPTLNHTTPAHDIIYITGIGSGKTFALLNDALMVALLNPKGSMPQIVFTEPTYPMISDIVIPMLEKILVNDWGIKLAQRRRAGEWYLSRTAPPDLYLPNGAHILFRSREHPDRLSGSNVAAVYLDEFTLDKRDEAYIRLKGRVRQTYVHRANGIDITSPMPCRKIVLAGTPESLIAVWFKERYLNKVPMIMGRATSRDNPFLPPDFIDKLRETYPKYLIDAYINGEWVNFAQKPVFYTFRRDKHLSKKRLIPSNERPVIISCDFNLDPMCWSLWQFDAAERVLVCFDEVKINNTGVLQAMPTLISKLSAHKGDIYITGDASGHTRSQTNQDTNYIMLKRILVEAFPRREISITAPQRNPSIVNSANAVNLRLEQRRIIINECCENLIESIECAEWAALGAIKKDGREHFSDTLRYIVYHYQPITSYERIKNIEGVLNDTGSKSNAA